MTFLDKTGLTTLWNKIKSNFLSNKVIKEDQTKPSITMGYNCSASGNYSIATGINSSASGYASRAYGMGVEATIGYSHAEGIYNLPEDGMIFQIGVGGVNSRKNAISVYGASGTKNGNIYIKNIGSYNGQNADSAQSLQDVISSLNSTIEDLQTRVQYLEAQG